MDGGRVVGRVVLALGIAIGMSGVADGDEPGVEAEPFMARLVRPDQQAAEILRLFEGARWRDPAAALAAWKQHHPESGLGKPAEALIALFNPEMAHEWRALDDAGLRLEIDRATGAPRWFVVVPRDDGTVAAAVTAMRLTHPDDRPLFVDGTAVPVARVGRSGVPLACQFGAAVVVANCRDWLERGLALAKDGRHPIPGDFNRMAGSDARLFGPEGGTVFRLEPDRLPTPPAGSLTNRRLIEALHAFGCRRVEGAALVKDGALLLDVSTSFADPGREDAARPPLSIDPQWLEALPSDRVMAMISIAIDPDSSSWDLAFAAADRIERVDPARARLAPLRTRLNLLALGTGLKLEADVRPHLRGVSACLVGDPRRPGRVTGGLVLLHLDDSKVAARLVQQMKPRLGGLVGDEASRASVLRARDRDIFVGWGEESRPVPGRSLASLCDAWADRGRRPPARVGALWPGRIWRPSGLTEAAARALEEDPPVIWWGWNEPGGAHDRLRWAGLDARVRTFLAAIPAGPVADSPLPAARAQESDFKIPN